MKNMLNNLTEDELHKLIGSNVAKIRIEKGFSQLAISLEIGNKSPSLFSSAELYKDKRHFNIAQLHKIAKVLDVDISDFFKLIDK